MDGQARGGVCPDEESYASLVNGTRPHQSRADMPSERMPTDIESARSAYSKVRAASEILRGGGWLVLLDDLLSLSVLMTPADGTDEDRILALGERAHNTQISFCIPKDRLASLGLLKDANEHESRITVRTSGSDLPSYALAAHLTTIRKLVDPSTTGAELSAPGYMQVHPTNMHGVLGRAGLSELSTDLCRSAGLYPAAVVMPIVDSHGAPLQPDGARAFARTSGVECVSVADMVSARLIGGPLVRQQSAARIPTASGAWRAVAYDSLPGPTTHLAMVCGETFGAAEVVVDIRPHCVSGLVFSSEACDCHEQLAAAMRVIGARGSGVVVVTDVNSRDKPEVEIRLLSNPNARGHRGLMRLPEMFAAAHILRSLGIGESRLLYPDPELESVMAAVAQVGEPTA